MTPPDTAPGKRLVSLVLPVFNEAGNLEPLARDIRTAMGDRAYEVIFVDDGSTDGSGDLLARLAEADQRIKLIRFRRNFGQTAALQAGFDHAAGEVIVTLDADGQNPPSEIPKLLDVLTGDVDMVAGYRLKRQDEAKRVFISRTANFLIRKITGVAIRDNGCTLKAMRAWCVRDLKLYGEMHRFIAAHIHRMGGVIREVGVEHHPRTSGVSKYGWNRVLKVFLDLITVSYFMGYANKPAYLFGGLGAGMGATSLILCVVVLYQKYVLGAWVHRNPLFLLAAFIGMAGLQFLLMGILAEVMMRTHHEATGVETYKIKETRNL